MLMSVPTLYLIVSAVFDDDDDVGNGRLGAS